MAACVRTYEVKRPRILRTSDRLGPSVSVSGGVVVRSGLVAVMVGEEESEASSQWGRFLLKGGGSSLGSLQRE